jgi:hypothetical protein
MDMERWPGTGPQDALDVARARMAQRERDAAAERLTRTGSGPERGEAIAASGLRGRFGRLLIRLGTALADDRTGGWNRDSSDRRLA